MTLFFLYPPGILQNLYGPFTSFLRHLYNFSSGSCHTLRYQKENGVSHLASYTGPLLSFQLGHGFGALANDAIALTSASDIELRSQPDFGHVDLLATPLHALRFEAHILEWIYTNVMVDEAYSP